MSNPKLKAENYTLLGGINTKASPYANTPMEFRNLENLHFKIPGALTQRPGSTLALGSTTSGRITGGIEFERLSGASYLVLTANTNVFNVTSGAFSAIQTGLTSGLLFDFEIFVDRLFYCSGETFKKWDGSNITNYSLPPGQNLGVTGVVGGGLSGVFLAAYGYLSDRGYQGPGSTGVTISLNGITFGSIQYLGMTAPTGYGITALVLYRTAPGLLDLTQTTFAIASATSATDTGFPLTTTLANDNLWFTLAPRYMEIFNNQLFVAGISSLPSTAFWSNIGEPEGIDPTFNAEFRTNDGDRITGLKSYQGALVVTKEKSCHLVRGDNPDNFLLQEISDQYGCLSHRSLVTWEDTIWWLDTKGICEYNGANIRIASNKIEPIFQSMNIAAAKDNACAIHFRSENEVWFAIPTDGSSYNNTIVVYDYIAQAWSTYRGLDASTLFIAQRTLPKETAFVGGYTGSLTYMGSTFTSDNGRGITTVMQPAFIAPEGQTTEAQWRRFYMNVEPVVGVTLPLTVNFRTNYGSSIILTRTMYEWPFQSRIDFGIPARAIQPEVIQSSATYPITIYGFTFEHRYQRSV